jgi:hypothetical protein
MTLTPFIPPSVAVPGKSPSVAGRLSFDQPVPERLVLDGVMDGKKMHLELVYQDIGTFPLVQSRFRWVREGGR